MTLTHPSPTHDASSTDGASKTPHTSVRSALKRTKLRLQHTGWLPYALTALAGTLFLLVSAAAALVGPALFWPPFCISALFFAIDAFDVATVRFGLRLGDPKPRRRDDLDAFELMRWRRACRSFRLRGLTNADREELMRAIRKHVRSAPMIGTSPIRLEHVFARKLATWPTVGAREFIVALAPHDYDSVSIIDVGRALQKVVLDATRMGVATCCIGPGTDLVDIQDLLGDRFDPERDHVVCICALGYRSRYLPLASRVVTRVQTGRRPLDELFFADARLREPLAVDEPPFSLFGPCYEGARWSPSAFNGQPTRCVAVADTTGNAVERFDFYTTTTSRYYAPVALGIWCGSWEAGCQALGVPGHFQVLTPEERGVTAPLNPPRYHVSWIPDDTAAITTLNT